MPYNNAIIIINEKYINYNNCVTQMNALLLSLMEVREVRIKSDNITHVAIIILVVDLKRWKTILKIFSLQLQGNNCCIEQFITKKVVSRRFKEHTWYDIETILQVGKEMLNTD